VLLHPLPPSHAVPITLLRACAHLSIGLQVSIGRNDVDTIVTEHGVAQLRGKSVAARVRELVSVAHPDVRADLLEQARRVGYL
jgi:acyl-CoA hydrolase